MLLIRDCKRINNLVSSSTKCEKLLQQMLIFLELIQDLRSILSTLTCIITHVNRAAYIIPVIKHFHVPMPASLHAYIFKIFERWFLKTFEVSNTGFKYQARLCAAPYKASLNGNRHKSTACHYFNGSRFEEESLPYNLTPFHYRPVSTHCRDI